MDTLIADQTRDQSCPQPLQKPPLRKKADVAGVEDDDASLKDAMLKEIKAVEAAATKTTQAAVRPWSGRR